MNNQPRIIINDWGILETNMNSFSSYLQKRLEDLNINGEEDFQKYHDQLIEEYNKSAQRISAKEESERKNSLFKQFVEVQYTANLSKQRKAYYAIIEEFNENFPAADFFMVSIDGTIKNKIEIYLYMVNEIIEKLEASRKKFKEDDLNNGEIYDAYIMGKRTEIRGLYACVLLLRKSGHIFEMENVMKAIRDFNPRDNFGMRYYTFELLLMREKTKVLKKILLDEIRITNDIRLELFYIASLMREKEILKAEKEFSKLPLEIRRAVFNMDYYLQKGIIKDLKVHGYERNTWEDVVAVVYDYPELQTMLRYANTLFTKKYIKESV